MTAVSIVVEPAAARTLADATGYPGTGTDAPLTLERVHQEADEEGAPRIIREAITLPNAKLCARRVGSRKRESLFLHTAGNPVVTVGLELSRDDLLALDELLPIYPDKVVLLGAMQRLHAQLLEARTAAAQLEVDRAALARQAEQDRAWAQETTARLADMETTIATLTAQLQRAETRSGS
jgi:hypothetical protein